MKRLLIITAAAWSAPALAHHPLAGQPMSTFADGVLSGVGHPLLGFDHLFFVVLVGIAAVYTGRALVAPLAYLAAMAVGVLLMTYAVALPGIEAMIGLSLLVLGGIVLSGRALRMPIALALFSVAGLFHGSAFGEAMAAAEAGAATQVLAGYLLGLSALQYALSIGAGWVALNVWKASESTAIEARLAGAVVAGVGLFLTLETLEGAAFSALGLA